MNSEQTHNIGSAGPSIVNNRNLIISRADSHVVHQNLNMTTVGGHQRNAPGIPLTNDLRSIDRSPVPQNINICNYSTIGDHNMIQAKTYASGFGLGANLSPSPNFGPTMGTVALKSSYQTADQSMILNPQAPTHQIKVSAQTWHRDSHGLFDFEANIYKKDQIIVQGSGLLNRTVGEEQIEFIEPSQIRDTKEDNQLSTLIYSQGHYFVYHNSDINMRDIQAAALSPAVNPDKDEMSPALKELAKKSYLVIKHKILPKEYQSKGGATAKLNTNSQEYFENRGVVLRTGDIVKFGRVPFRVKENSLQILEGQVWHDSFAAYDEINMNSIEKNITDIDSADLEREFVQGEDNESMHESNGGFQIRGVRGAANDPFGMIEGASEIEQQINNRTINGENANHNRNNSLLDQGLNSSRGLNPNNNQQALVSNHDIFGETAHGESMKFQSNFLFGHAPHLPTSVFVSPAAGEINQKYEKDFRLTGFSKKAKLRMARGAAALEKANTQNNQQPKTCRICLGDENEEDNELISPCKCAGTMRHIHLKCLQEWIGGKKSIRELPFSTIYLYRMASCELCKVNFPDYVKEKNKKIEIFKIQRPTDGHYIILEVLGMPTGKTFQVIRLSERHSLKIGRGHDSDVRVADISVSRCHSLLRYDSVNNQVILSDYHSKFGTLVLMRQPLRVPENLELGGHDMQIQCGRTMIQLTMEKIKKPFFVQLCKCLTPKMSSDKILANYQEYFQCYEDLPKDLMRYKRILMRDKSRAFAIHSGQIMSHMNTIKINDDMFDEQGRNANVLMSEGGEYFEGDRKKSPQIIKISNQNVTGFFGVSPIRKNPNKIHPLNQSNISSDAGGGLQFNLVGVRPPIQQSHSPSNQRGIPRQENDLQSGYIGDLNNHRQSVIVNRNTSHLESDQAPQIQVLQPPQLDESLANFDQQRPIIIQEQQQQQRSNNIMQEEEKLMDEICLEQDLRRNSGNHSSNAVNISRSNLEAELEAVIAAQQQSPLIPAQPIPQQQLIAEIDELASPSIEAHINQEEQEPLQQS